MILDDMTDVLKSPFGNDLDLTHLFLLVGLIIVIIAVWGFILHHIKLAAQELAS